MYKLLRFFNSVEGVAAIVFGSLTWETRGRLYSINQYFDSDIRTTTIQIYTIHIMWNSIVVHVKITQVLFQRQLRFNNRSELSLQRLYVAHHLDNWPGSIAALVSKYSNPNSRFGLLCFHIYCPLHSMRQFTSAEIGWGCKLWSVIISIFWVFTEILSLKLLLDKCNALKDNAICRAKKHIGNFFPMK